MSFYVTSLPYYHSFYQFSIYSLLYGQESQGVGKPLTGPLSPSTGPRPKKDEPLHSGSIIEELQKKKYEDYLQELTAFTLPHIRREPKRLEVLLFISTFLPLFPHYITYSSKPLHF
jgi:hypothetical protein